MVENEEKKSELEKSYDYLTIQEYSKKTLEYRKLYKELQEKLKDAMKFFKKDELKKLPPKGLMPVEKIASFDIKIKKEDVRNLIWNIYTSLKSFVGTIEFKTLLEKLLIPLTIPSRLLSSIEKIENISTIRSANQLMLSATTPILVPPVITTLPIATLNYLLNYSLDIFGVGKYKIPERVPATGAFIEKEIATLFGKISIELVITEIAEDYISAKITVKALGGCLPIEDYEVIESKIEEIVDLEKKLSTLKKPEYFMNIPPDLQQRFDVIKIRLSELNTHLEIIKEILEKKEEKKEKNVKVITSLVEAKKIQEEAKKEGKGIKKEEKTKKKIRGWKISKFLSLFIPYYKKEWEYFKKSKEELKKNIEKIVDRITEIAITYKVE